MSNPNLFVIIFLIAYLRASIHIQQLKLAQNTVTTAATTKFTTPVNTCECAGFSQLIPTPYDQPTVVKIISRNMTCDLIGEKSCSTLCKAVIENSKKNSNGLCSFFNNMNYKMLGISVRVCRKYWFYTGLTIKNDLCCKRRKGFQCIDYRLLGRNKDKFPIGPRPKVEEGK